MKNRRILAEYAAANLVEGGQTELQQLCFLPAGEAADAIFSDVLEMTASGDGRLVIGIARPTPADGFPDAFFRMPDETFDPAAWQAEQEARDAFFQILLHEPDALRMALLLHQREDLLWSDKRLCALWGLPAALQPRQQSIMAGWMPQLNLMAGDYDWIAKCFSAIANVPVCIVAEDAEKTTLEGLAPKHRLGSCVVGKSCILGHTAHTHWQTLTVCVGPVSLDNLAEWGPEFQKRQALEALYDWFFGADTFVFTRILIKKETDRQPIIGTASCTIGYAPVVLC